MMKKPFSKIEKSISGISVNALQMREIESAVTVIFSFYCFFAKNSFTKIQMKKVKRHARDKRASDIMGFIIDFNERVVLKTISNLNLFC